MGQQLSRFLAIGALAYGVDVGLFLYLTIHIQLDLEVARVCAFVVVVLLTYVLNGRFTFRTNLSRSGLAKYSLVQVCGTALNLGLFWLTIQPWLNFQPVLALTLGSMAGSTFNFIMMRKVIFTGTRLTVD